VVAYDEKHSPEAVELDLHEWFLANMPDGQLMYCEAMKQQVMFVRDKLAGILARAYDEYKKRFTVSGTHRSKSVVLPVYYARPLSEKGELVEVWMRDNFIPELPDEAVKIMKEYTSRVGVHSGSITTYSGRGTKRWSTFRSYKILEEF
jgi:hypothetical protein